MKKEKKYIDEYVLVFPTKLLHEIGYFNGIEFDTDRYLNEILKPENHEYMNRNSAEDDPSYKQLIPYIIIHHQDTVFSYCRGKLMGEKRLLGNFSVGIGGHISVDDSALFGTTYEDGMKRELNEEVEVRTVFSEHKAALINDDSNDVGKVHFGVVHLLSVDEPLVKPREKSINKSEFLSLSDLQNNRENYETWSQICIDNIDKMLYR